MTSEPASVAVIGAGTMGRGIANTFAVSGHRVALADSDLQIAERAKSTINGDLTVAIEEGFVPAAALEAVLRRIEPVETLEEAVEGAGVVVEAVPEILDLKVEIWRRLGESADEDTILASNTSSFDINELARVVERRPERVIGTHWYNPAHIVPCVEVIPAETTSRPTIDATIEPPRRARQGTRAHQERSRLCRQPDPDGDGRGGVPLRRGRHRNPGGGRRDRAQLVRLQAGRLRPPARRRSSRA